MELGCCSAICRYRSVTFPHTFLIPMNPICRPGAAVVGSLRNIFFKKKKDKKKFLPLFVDFINTRAAPD